MCSIYISTFGKPVIRIKDGIPIEVGAASWKNFIYNLHDDMGDNISSENEYYGEMTGLYWIWKNVTIEDDDIIGFCHYNKALAISNKKANDFLRRNGSAIITVSPIKIRNHPLKDEVKAVTFLLEKFYPEYHVVWDKLYDGEAAGRYEVCRGSNMFITTGKVFKSYCAWIFPLLKELRKLLGDKSESDANMRRYCAFMSERLLSVYIEANQLLAWGVEVRYKKWWLFYVRWITRKFRVNRKSKIYIFLKKRFGYNSQYGR